MRMVSQMKFRLRSLIISNGKIIARKISKMYSNKRQILCNRCIHFSLSYLEKRLVTFLIHRRKPYPSYDSTCSCFYCLRDLIINHQLIARNEVSGPRAFTLFYNTNLSTNKSIESYVWDNLWIRWNFDSNLNLVILVILYLNCKKQSKIFINVKIPLIWKMNHS